MTIVNKYIAFTIFRFFAMGLLAVLGMVIVIDYLTNLDEFLQAQISTWRAFEFVLLKLPFIGSQLIPVVLLLAILMTFGIMSRHNELLVLQAGGISIYQLLRPVMLIAVLAALLLFVLSEVVNPLTMSKANEIKYGEIRKSDRITVKQENIWIKGPQTITHIALFHPSGKTIQGFTRYYLNQNFRLLRRLDARAVEFDNGRWSLIDGLDQIFDPQTDSFRVTPFKMKDENLELQPAEFRAAARRSEEMSLRQISAYVDRIEKEGYNAHAYRVDLYHKTAYPFVCVIMGLIGIALSAKKRLGLGLSIAVSIGLVITFIYWTLQGLFLSLGHGGILPPLVAAWGANLFFICGALVMLIKAE